MLMLKNILIQIAVKEIKMSILQCPKCGKELNNYEIEKLWCTNCNAKFNNIYELCDGDNLDFTTDSEDYLKFHSFLVTTGYNFEGYTIDKYFNLINGEIVMGTGFLSELSAQVNDFLGTTSNTLERKLQKAKELAMRKVINSAIEIGSNAVIGFKYEMFSLSDNILSVSAYATAVHVNKTLDN